MFCNFCGKKIAPEDRVCPYCGQAQESRSGGNGFWDILTNQSPVDDADPEPMRTVREPVRPMREPAPPMPTPPAPADRRRKKTSRGILILSIITVVLLLASIAFDVLLFLNIGKKTDAIIKQIDKPVTELNESTEALEPEGEHTLPDYSPSEKDTATHLAEENQQDAGIETPSPEIPESPAEGDQKDPHILTQPVVTEKKEDGVEFTIEYAGIEAVWKFFDVSNNEWKKIDTASGKFVIDNDTQNKSTLRIVGDSVDPNTFYVCVVTGENKKELWSDTVWLNPSSADPSEPTNP